MALTPFSRDFIELPVADRRIHDTLIRQRARYQSMLIVQDDAAIYQVRLFVKVFLYAADGDGFGPALSGNGLLPYMVELTADNDTLVAFPAGTILAIRPYGQPEADWQATIASFEEATALQGDYFAWLAENAELGIAAMIRQHIQQADAMGRFV